MQLDPSPVTRRLQVIPADIVRALPSIGVAPAVVRVLPACDPGGRVVEGPSVGSAAGRAR